MAPKKYVLKETLKKKQEKVEEKTPIYEEKKYQVKQQIEVLAVKQQNPTKKQIGKKYFDGKMKEDKKYINFDIQKVEPIGDLVDSQDARRLKKYLKISYPSADRIILKYQTDKPIIFLEYLLNGKITTSHIRDLLRANEQLKKENKLIQRLYSKLYDTVDDKYFNIGIFGVDHAQQKRIRIRKQLIKQNKFSHKDFFFYYAIQNLNKINFVIFDKNLNTVEFNSKIIENLKEKYSRYYNIYQRFIDEKIKPKISQQKIIDDDLTMFQQVDSDQEQRQKKIKNRKQMPNYSLYHKIQTIANKDLSKYEEEIQMKNQDVNRLHDSNQMDQAARIADQIMELDENVENFKTIRDDVMKRIKDNQDDINVLKPCLKRLIIAEKQLASQLPIISRKRQIFEKLRKNNLLILEGETGSGKSTQLPQILCEFYDIFHNEKSLPVLVTQPRKLATRTLAQRVASEMEEQIHGFVDYQASAHTIVNEKAKIIFKMDRLVLDELKQDEILSKYCCLVIDQAHQRTISIDVILGLIKKLLQKRKDFKIIVTSASMDTDLFKKYYGTQILKVSGRMFPVEEIYRPYYNCSDITKKIQKLFDEQIMEGGNIRKNYKGHILVFCSGMQQIERLCKIFQGRLNPRIFKIMPLHGRLSPEEQKNVFNPCKEVKLIFASRIAETSITIDGIKVVIDAGEDIQQYYDQKTKITSMRLAQISQSSAKQRAGRAGRTNQGYCFRLYEREAKNRFQVNKKPEIQNMALDTLVLRLKSLKISNVVTFPYISPPNNQALKISVETVKMLGCLDQNENITPIGQFLLKIPVEPFLSRSIIQAYIYTRVLKKIKQSDLKMAQIEINKLVNMNLVEQVIGILCMVVNAGNLFFVRFQDREKAEKVKFQKLSNQSGDFNFFRNIFSKYSQFMRYKNFHELDRWMKNHYLNKKALKQVYDLYKQIDASMKKFILNEQFIKQEMSFSLAKLKNCDTAQDVIMSSLVTSFATNLCLYSQNQHIGYTLISQQLSVQIYGTSILSIQGINPKWIICYDLYQNDKGQTYCKVAHNVDYKFLLQHVNPYIIDKYNVKKAENFNPFYNLYKKKVSTLVLLKIQQLYRNREKNQNSFLLKFNMLFYEDLNQIHVFYQMKNFEAPKKSLFGIVSSKFNNILSNEKQNVEQNPVVQIQNFMSSIEKTFTKFYHHNFVGPIFIYLKDGFQLVDIEFKMTQSLFKVFAEGEQAGLIEQHCSLFGQMERFNDRLDFYICQQENKANFKENLHYLIEFFETQGKKIKVQETIADRRKKIPQAKLFLRFWAAQKSQKNNLLLLFDKSKNVNVLQHFQRLKAGIKQSMKNRFQRNIFTSIKVSLTKKRDSINLFPAMQNTFDEIEIYDQLMRMNERGYLGYGFQMPRTIKKFREPDTVISAKKDQDWNKQIQNLMRKIGINDKKCTIRTWGYYDKSKRDGPKSHIESTFRIDMHSQIKSYDVNQLEKFRAKYNKGTQVLGTQKVHAQFQFEQIAAVTTLKVFKALEDEYQYIIMRQKAQAPKINIEWFSKKHKNVTKVYIKIRGSKRQEILKPTRTINKLFTPKYINLDEAKFRFLDKFDQGNDILESIESKHNYKIYFAFERRSMKIKLYSQDRLENQIRDQLIASLDKFKYYDAEVSYRGKNLHKVVEVLTQLKQEIREQNNKQKYMHFEINYKFRKVRIIGDLNSFDKAKNQMLKLVNQEKSQCDICSDLLQRPYCLATCKHSFCWVCLSSYIKQTINQASKDLLECPASCGCKINIYDVMRILSVEDFNRICDLRISRYIEKDPKYHGCFSANCENIFLTEQSQKYSSFQCQLCGKWYCLKCKEPHKGMSCSDWKISTNESLLKDLGVKKCPKCGQGIQKNAGCQHMECIKCHSHICWNCMQFFQNSQKCYAHLQKIHGSYM